MTSIVIAVLGAVIVNINDLKMQNRKLKEQHYVSYLEALHNLATDNKNTEFLNSYVLHRDKIFIVASEKVVMKILEYEKEAVGKTSEVHDEYLTEIIKEIRKDLKIKDKKFPVVSLRKGKS